jgi:hypothetical protein
MTDYKGTVTYVDTETFGQPGDEMGAHSIRFEDGTEAVQYKPAKYGAPKIGEFLEGTLEPRPGKLPKFKRRPKNGQPQRAGAAVQGAIKSYNGDDKARQRSIVRQSSMKAAVQVVTTLFPQASQGEEGLKSKLKYWADFFEADVNGLEEVKDPSLAIPGPDHPVNVGQPAAAQDDEIPF